MTTPKLVVEFVLDETGSMKSHTHAVVAGFNSFVKDQKEETGCRLSLSLFSDGKVRTPYQDFDVAHVFPMAPSQYDAHGGTNLYDAVRARIASAKARENLYADPVQMLFVVMTDGEDTMSRNRAHDIKDIIESAPDNWTFVFMGSSNKALITAASMGFKNVKVFQNSEITQTFSDFSRATTAYQNSAFTASFF